MTHPAPTPRASLLGRALAGSLLLAAVGFFGTYVAFRNAPTVEAPPTALPPSASVAAVPSDLPKQGPNECGAYSLTFAVRCRGQDADPKAMIGAVWHDAFAEALSGTLPWKIRAELRRRGLTGEAYTARSAPPEQRLDLVRGHVAKGRPVILLIESERGTQHWVLALGYGAEGVDLYDPNVQPLADDASRTQDQNGARPGNRTLSEEALLRLWGRGGGAGLYTWWYLPVDAA